MGFDAGLLFQGMTMALIKMVVGADCEPAVHVSTRGTAVRLQVLDSEGGVTMTVYGDGGREAGQQLVLACLQRLGVRGLRELHQRPLKKAAPLASV